MGNLPAYSTTAFLPRCLWERPPEPHRLNAAAPLGPRPALASRRADLVGQHKPWRMQRILLSLPFCLPSLH